MEPTRYWLLCLGVLLIFLGSRAGQATCLFVFNALRSAFYLTLALLATCGALFFYGLSIVFAWLEKLMESRSENPDIVPPVRAKI